MKTREFTLANVFTPHSSGRHRNALTLAEVLITLGIIGVVAALTIPNLMSNHRKNVVVERLKKGSSSIMQAHNFANAEYGSDRESFSYFNPDEALEIFNKYYTPYMRFAEVKKGVRGVFGYLEDGTALYFVKNANYEGWANTYLFFCVTHKACKNVIETDYDTSLDGLANGKDIFVFYTNGIVPKYTFAVEDRAKRIADCKLGTKESCTALIYEEGWRIPKDYPVGF